MGEDSGGLLTVPHISWPHPYPLPCVDEAHQRVARPEAGEQSDEQEAAGQQRDPRRTQPGGDERGPKQKR